jgi:hypothetical protein
MKIAKIQIQNILGIRELEITADAVTEISGRNGEGKTSVLGAVRAALGMYDYPTARLVHDGADKGMVVLVLDDGSTIRRTITRDETALEVRDSEGHKVKAPKSVIDALFDITQFNPLKLLRDDKKSRDERLATIIECMPIQVTKAEILKLAPEIQGQIDQIRTDRHGLDVIEDVYARLFERRTDINREGKATAATVEQLEASMPEEDVDGDADRKSELQKAKKTLETKREERIAEYEAERRSSRETAMRQCHERLAEADRIRQAAIEAANNGYELAKRDLECVRDEALQLAEEAFTAKKDAKLEQFNSLYQPIITELAKIEERDRTRVAIETQRRLLKDHSQKLDVLRAQSGALTETLARLKAHKQALLDKSPIPGLEIRDGEAFFEGLPFDQLNTAKKISLAVQLAALRAGQMAVICVDGCEALDAKSRALLEAACAERGLQMICTTVDDTPLTITTKAEPASPIKGLAPATIETEGGNDGGL